MYFENEAAFHLSPYAPDSRGTQKKQVEDNEIPPQDGLDTLDKNITTPSDMQQSILTNSDPKNITDDSGSIVDYDLLGKGPSIPAPDYDYDSWKKANPDTQMSPGQHYPDTYKLPNHMTFSDESIYHSDTTPGGHWGQEDGKDTFTPSEYNLKQHTPEEMQDYFKRVEPDVTLKLPIR